MNKSFPDLVTVHYKKSYPIGMNDQRIISTFTLFLLANTWPSRHHNKPQDQILGVQPIHILDAYSWLEPIDSAQ